MVSATQFTISKKQKDPKCLPTDEWIKKMGYICTIEYSIAKKILVT
jgi:hypothetical protein